MTRVLLAVHQYFPNWIGGTEMLVRGLATRLERDGHEPVIATYEESPANDPAQYQVWNSTQDGVEVFHIPYNLSCAQEPSRAEYDNTDTARNFGAVLDRIAPDVVHVAHAMKLSGAIFAAAQSRGIPIVTTLSDYWFLCLRHTLVRPDGSLCSGPDRRYKCLHCAAVTHGFAKPFALEQPEPQLSETARRTERYRAALGPFWPFPFARDVVNIAERLPRSIAALQRSDRIIALSKFLRDLYVRYGVGGDRISLLRHGPEDVGHASIKAGRGRLPAGKLEIVSIGTLADFKGPHVLVEALARVPDLDCRLLLYGRDGPDPAYTGRLRQLAARDARVALTGTFPPERMGDVLATASVLAHPSIWYENEPLVIKDALLAGVPVAASDIGTLPELIAGVDGCILLPAGDVGAWADWLRGLGTTPPPRTVDAPDLPTMEDFYRNMLAIYQELAVR